MCAEKSDYRKNQFSDRKQNCKCKIVGTINWPLFLTIADNREAKPHKKERPLFNSGYADANKTSIEI